MSSKRPVVCQCSNEECTCSNINNCCLPQVNSNSKGANEDTVMQLQRSLAKAQQKIKTKEILIKIQAEQLKKMEDMYKKCLDENENLNYANKKTCHDLENLKIILKQYEGKFTSANYDKNSNYNMNNANEEQYKALYQVIQAQDDKIETILKLCKEKKGGDKTMEDEVIDLKNISRKLSEIANEKIECRDDKKVLQNVISTLMFEIGDLRFQVGILKKIEQSQEIVDDICETTRKYLELHLDDAGKPIFKRAILSHRDQEAVSNLSLDGGSITRNSGSDSPTFDSSGNAGDVKTLRQPNLKTLNCLYENTTGPEQEKDSSSESPTEALLQDIVSIKDDKAKIFPIDKQILEIVKDRVDGTYDYRKKQNHSRSATHSQKVKLDDMSSPEIRIEKSNLLNENKALGKQLADLQAEKDALHKNLVNIQKELQELRQECGQQQGCIEENTRLKKELKGKEKLDSCEYVAFRKACLQHIEQLKSLTYTCACQSKGAVCESSSNHSNHEECNKEAPLIAENSSLKQRVQTLEQKIMEAEKFKCLCLLNIKELKLLTVECNSVCDVVRDSITTEKEVCALNTEISQLKKTIQKCVSEADTKECELCCEANSLKDNLEQVQETLIESRRKCANLESALSEADNNYYALKDKVQKLEEESASLIGDFDTLQMSYCETRDEIDQLKDEYVQQLNDELEKLKKENKRVQLLLEKSQNANEKYLELLEGYEKEKRMSDELAGDNLLLQKQNSLLVQTCECITAQKEQLTCCFDAYKNTTETLKTMTCNEMKGLREEVSRLEKIQPTSKKQVCETQIQTQPEKKFISTENMQRILDEREDYKEKLAILSQKIDSRLHEHQMFKLEAEKRVEELRQENDVLKFQLEKNSMLSSGEGSSLANFCSDDPEKTVSQLMSFIKLKEIEIRVTMEQREKAKMILENVSKYKNAVMCQCSYTSSDSDSSLSLDCSAAIYSVQTNIQALLNSLQKQNEEYGSCNLELQLRDDILSKKIMDIEEKKNCLLHCLSNINNSLQESTVNAESIELDSKPSTPPYCCPHQ